MRVKGDETQIVSGCAGTKDGGERNSRDSAAVWMCGARHSNTSR